jgi:hypothetical protein
MLPFTGFCDIAFVHELECVRQDYDATKSSQQNSLLFSADCLPLTAYGFDPRPSLLRRIDAIDAPIVDDDHTLAQREERG